MDGAAAAPRVKREAEEDEPTPVYAKPELHPDIVVKEEEQQQHDAKVVVKPEEQPGVAAAAAPSAPPNPPPPRYNGMPVRRVAGFDVPFPHEPYGVQCALMNQILRALDQEGNALLEAPTGCGKTLSILCSALAWQLRLRRQAAETAVRRLARRQRQQQQQAQGVEDKAGCQGPGGGQGAGGKDGGSGDNDNADNDDDDDDDDLPPPPKIFYATRTHSQIAQVVRELKRVAPAYRPKVAVLASRPHYCVNQAALRSPLGVEGACEEMAREGGGGGAGGGGGNGGGRGGCNASSSSSHGCSYRRGSHRLTHSEVGVHDVEDLVAAGRRARACPYFAARSLAESADLVFLPYAYLLDPLVRAAADVRTRGAVLVFDEAHNIEDMARWVCGLFFSLRCRPARRRSRLPLSLSLSLGPAL
jgi:fanconi anemia group J protein